MGFILPPSSLIPGFRRLGLCGSASGFFAVAAFQDFLADFLGGGFDLLHFFADARAGGLVAADCFGDVLIRLGHQTLQCFVFQSLQKQNLQKGLVNVD